MHIHAAKEIKKLHCISDSDFKHCFFGSFCLKTSVKLLNISTGQNVNKIFVLQKEHIYQKSLLTF